MIRSLLTLLVCVSLGACSKAPTPQLTQETRAPDPALATWRQEKAQLQSQVKEMTNQLEEAEKTIAQWQEWGERTNETIRNWEAWATKQKPAERVAAGPPANAMPPEAHQSLLHAPNAPPGAQGQLGSKKPYVLEGTLRAIDWKTFRLTIRRNTGRDTVVQIVRQTKVNLDEKPSNWRALKEGQTVRCLFDTDTYQALGVGIYEQIDPR